MAPTTETLEGGGSEDLSGIQKYSCHDLSAYIYTPTFSENNLACSSVSMSVQLEECNFSFFTHFEGTVSVFPWSRDKSDLGRGGDCSSRDIPHQPKARVVTCYLKPTRVAAFVSFCLVF